MANMLQRIVDVCAVALTTGFILAGAGPASVSQAETQRTLAQQILSDGEREFRISCAACHGNERDGVMPRDLFTITPADLTALSRNNGGQFPFTRVVNVIDGRVDVKGHGRKTMPVWGERFMIQALLDVNPHAAPSVVKSRILSLTLYLQSIQVDPKLKD